LNKIWPYAITIILLISTSACHQVLAAALPTTTTKTYQDYGLGFTIEYPANLIQADASAASNDLQEVRTTIALNYHIRLVRQT
jgi:hypothetical protein